MPVGRGGKQGRVVQSCESQAAPLPCEPGERNPAASLLPALPAPLPRGCPLPTPLILLLSSPVSPTVGTGDARARALCSSELQQWELCVWSEVPGAGGTAGHPPAGHRLCSAELPRCCFHLPVSLLPEFIEVLKSIFLPTLACP